MSIEKCKNCGHDVMWANERWYHVSIDKGNEPENNDYNLCRKCYHELGTDEAEEFKENEMRKIDEVIKEHFGNYYSGEFYFFEIECMCKSPEA